MGLCFMFLSDEGPTLETLDFTIHIGKLFIFEHCLRSTLRLFHWLITSLTAIRWKCIDSLSDVQKLSEFAEKSF